MDKKYEFVIDNNKQYFFDKKKYKFKTVEKLEKYFKEFEAIKSNFREK